jgi:hypothetical protein
MLRRTGSLRTFATITLTAFTLSACLPSRDRGPRIDPDVARAQIERLLPAKISSRGGWAVDIYSAFEALGIEPSAQNSCAVIAVTEQESTFEDNPRVAGLSSIAMKQIDSKASDYGIPRLVVRAALEVQSTDGRTYHERLKKASTEKELNDIYEDFIGRVPLGQRLFGDLNPVRTGGPMQVSIAFAEKHAKSERYPYPVHNNIRNEVFTRRGGMYFGIAHLLDYPVPYTEMVYRFADFNAGHYASRNAAFQNAVNGIAKTKLALDGDLVLHGPRSAEASKTELAVRKIADRLRLSESQVREDLERADDESFTHSRLYERVFDVADDVRGRRVPRAMLPEIQLKSPKIQRKLTTGWFAQRVQGRYEKCLARASSTSR